MGCSACSQRKSTGRSIPINPNKKPAERQGNPQGAVEKGNTLRQRLRFTGR